jgi:bla regulator protein blaR1
MRIVGLVILCVCMVDDVFGQASETQLTFEVASVKPSAPDVTGMFIRPLPGGGLQVTGASLRNLISFAYDVRPFQIFGGSPWVDTERYDIDARPAASEGSTPTDPAKMSQQRRSQEGRKMLERVKSLLADRFQLALHSETKQQQPVYALVVNKGRPKLRESAEPTGLIRKMGRGTLKAQAVGLGMLALNLSNELGRPVIDKTGLAGKYDFELKWASSQASAPQLGAPPRTTDFGPPANPDGPSIFAALQEQLGLRLETAKGPVEVLVIDRAQRPSEN